MKISSYKSLLHDFSFLSEYLPMSMERNTREEVDKISNSILPTDNSLNRNSCTHPLSVAPPSPRTMS